MFQLSVCVEPLIGDLSFAERVQEVSHAGFLVEFWRWPSHEQDLDAIAEYRGVKIATFSGSLDGSMVHPDGVAEYLEGVNQSVEIAHKLNCRELLLLTGKLSPQGEVVHKKAAHPATMWITAYKTLCEVAEIAERENLLYNLEPLNTVLDHPGYAIPRPEDCVRLISEVGSPRIKMLLDVYHVQMEQGNVIETIRQYRDYLGYIHIADVPGRHEPGTGEINYPQIAQTLRDVSYSGTIGLECWPDGDLSQAMQAFREVFG